MKTKLLLSTLLLAGWGLSSYAQDATEVDTVTFKCIADTWIRQSQGGEKRGTADSIELGYDGENTRAGLLGFSFSVPDGMKVQSATFRIFSKLARTGKPVYVYAYPHDFTEGDACWNVEVEYHDAALEQEPIAEFIMKGHGGKSIYDNGINADNQSLEKWTNEIDLTSYVKSLPATTTRINIMMKHEEMSRFYPQGLTGEESCFPGTDNAMSVPKADFAPVLVVTFVEDAASSTERILPVADTQIRKGNKDDKSKADAIEIKSTAAGDEFYGLMRFSLPSEVLDTVHYELTGATLRLVCTQNKGDRGMLIYNYGNDFAENTNWDNEGTNVEDALAAEPIAKFSAAGLGTMSMSDDKANGNWANFTTADAWTSTIDLTDYINGKISDNAGSFNILIKKENTHNDAMKFATKEASDVTNAGVNSNGGTSFTFAAADLVPQLTVSYVKKEVSEDPAEDEEKELEFEPSDENTEVTIDTEEGTIEIVTSNEESVELKITAPEGTKSVYYMIEPESEESDINALAAPEGYREVTPNADGTFSVALEVGSKGILHLQYVKADDSVKTETYTYNVTFDGTSGIYGVETANDAKAEYFNLQGAKIVNPDKGIFIKVEGGKATKVIK